MNIKAVITGDIVHSEQIALEHRGTLISTLRDVVAELQPLSPMQMEMFRGDSFQIVVERPETSMTIATMVRAGLKAHSPSSGKSMWDARVSVGIGTTDYLGYGIVTSDGEAFRLSGRGLDAMGKSRLAASTRWHGVNEEVPVGLAFADDLITHWSVGQAKTVYLSVAMGLSQSEIARATATSQQNVSKTLAAARESLLTLFLNRFTTIVNNHNYNEYTYSGKVACSPSDG